MEKENQIIAWALQNNPEAIAYCTMVFEASQMFDDWMDGDKEVPNEAIMALMWNLFVALPNNSFYREHIKSLATFNQVSLTDWFAANELERGDDHDKNIAFVLRDRISGLLTHCATLLGGYPAMQATNVTVRRSIHNETLEDYKSGFGGQQVTDEEDAEYDMIETAIAAEEVES